MQTKTTAINYDELNGESDDGEIVQVPTMSHYRNVFRKPAAAKTAMKTMKGMKKAAMKTMKGMKKVTGRKLAVNTNKAITDVVLAVAGGGGAAPQPAADAAAAIEPTRYDRKTNTRKLSTRRRNAWKRFRFRRQPSKRGLEKQAKKPSRKRRLRLEA